MDWGGLGSLTTRSRTKMPVRSGIRQLNALDHSSNIDVTLVSIGNLIRVEDPSPVCSFMVYRLLLPLSQGMSEHSKHQISDQKGKRNPINFRLPVIDDCPQLGIPRGCAPLY